MKKVLLVLAIICGICYYYNPTFEDHIAALKSNVPETSALLSKADTKLEENLDYINLLIFSATKDKLRLSMVTLGFLTKVTIVDEKWVKQLFKS
jgi:hypothetical protein